MIENYQSGLICKTMGRNLAFHQAMKEVGFTPGTMEVAWPPPPETSAPYLFGGIEVDGYLRDWPNVRPIVLDRSSREGGFIQNDQDLRAEIRLGWDEEALYLFAKVSDSDVIAKKSGKNIWMDDCVELYIDPQGHGFFWNDPDDFQIGFSPDPASDRIKVWSWFQGGEDPSQKAGVKARGFVDKDGYFIEAVLRWNVLGVTPKAGDTVRLSVAVHDIDRDQTEAKVHWFFRNEEEWKRFELGKVLLSRSPSDPKKFSLKSSTSEKINEGETKGA